MVDKYASNEAPSAEEFELDSDGQSDNDVDAASNEISDEEVLSEIDVAGAVAMSKPAKRHLQTEEDDDGTIKKKAKKLGKELYRPPTAEEMNQLRETENLFHSNLFRLQIDEMLKEVKIKQKYQNRFENWFEELKSFLDGIKSSKEYKLSDTSWLKKKEITIPVDMDSSCLTGTFMFMKPLSAVVIGSYAAECRPGPKVEIDIRIEIPEDCLLRSDFLNQRYLYKRALYLAQLAAHLKSWDQVEKIEFSLQECQPLKPVLRIIPAGKLGKKTTVVLFVSAPSEYFKLKQLCPEKANIKTKAVHSSKEQGNHPMPHYNRSIAEDLVQLKNEEYRIRSLDGMTSVREGIMLLKVWLHQRELDVGYGAFNSFIMSMYVLYLLKTRRLNSIMSSYQIMRNTWNNLAQSNWMEEGITLAEESECRLTVADFHPHFDVVFVDTSGYVNLCANMNKATFLTVKRESALAVKCLDNSNINSFQALFMTPMPFYRQFDHLVSFFDKEALKQAEEKVGQAFWDQDVSGPWRSRNAIVDLLARGLGKRVSHLAVQSIQMLPWSTDAPPPNPSDYPLLLGLSLDPDSAFSLLDKGPPANKPEAQDFIQFWGDKSEVRRFQDGSICEAVVWPSGGVAKRRLLCRDVIHHLAERHFDIKPTSLRYIADQVDSILAFSSREEGALAVTKVNDALGRQLMQLQNLPLDISSTQGSAACLRYADPFPPCQRETPKLKFKKDSYAFIVKASEMKVAKWLAPIPVVLTLALSSKWPEDFEAVRRIKAAFYIKIAECLKEQCQLLAHPYPDFVDVLKEGYVFRVSVYHPREVSLLKETQTAQGLTKFKDNEESLSLEKRMVHLPKLTSALHGLHMLHSALGPASCLAKRWVSAHMLLGDFHMPEPCVELLMASIFLASEPYRVPLQPQAAFLRFLEKLTQANWATEPVILNFNEEMTRSEVLEIENRFNSERDMLPPLFIATPDSRQGNVWTRHSPSLLILSRISQLAQASLATLDDNLLSNPTFDTKQIFRTPYSPFDVIIHLWNSCIRLDESVDFAQPRGPILKKKRRKEERIPIVGLDLVQCFLKELREAYDDFALFFYDQHGGREICVLLKPNALKPQEFKVSQINCQKPQLPKKLVFNMEAMLDDFAIMGDGLIKSVTLKGEKHVKEDKDVYEEY